jgi:hypothetical protein
MANTSSERRGRKRNALDGDQSNAGTFRLHTKQQFLSQALNGHYIGLEQVSDGIWNILFYDTLLGRFDEPNKRITGAPAIREKC